MASGLTWVSVVFETEVALLELQARSMSRFLPDELVSSILVIDNSGKGMSRSAKESLLSSYGRLAPAVRILVPGDITKVSGATGWRSQQVLKLCVAAKVDTKHYVALDAKNHFVAAPRPGHFVSPEGRPRAHVRGFADHPLKAHLQGVLTYVGLDPAQHVDRFTETAPPFVFDRDLVLELIDDIEQRSGNPFPDEFVEHGLTEFFLYSAWLVSKGRTLDEAFEVHDEFCPVVWPGKADAAGVRRAIENVHRLHAPVFGVHRRALRRLDAEASALLASFWSQVGLFESTDRALAFISEFQRTYARINRAKQLRELRYRARTLPQAAARRLSGKQTR